MPNAITGVLYCAHSRDDRRDFLGAVREGDRVGGVRRVIRFVLAVLLADCASGRQPIAETLAQRGEQRRVERRSFRNGGGHFNPARC